MRVSRYLILVAALLSVPRLTAADELPSSPLPAELSTLAAIRDAALGSDYAMAQLTLLSDTIGPRLSGSRQSAAAVSQVAAAMRALGATVQLQPVTVPHWVRGEERAELVDYPGRPEGVSQRIVLTALGGSAATPAKGLRGELLVLHSLAELQQRAAEVRGRIVLLSVPFDQNLADNGQAGPAYVQGLIPRLRAPAAAAKLGAAAVLVRSIGGASYRLPHTGDTRWDEGGPRIPAAAVTVEDALLIERLAAQGPVTLQLLLTPQTLPDTQGYNVIADWPGREQPEQFVVVSGHLDSWDLGTAATDDGAGLVVAMATLSLMKDLGLKPRRSLRFIGFANEENGLRGSAAYLESVTSTIDRQVAAIESDAGAGRPLGLQAHVPLPAMAWLEPLKPVLQTLGAAVIEHSERAPGADIAPLQKAGVPGFEPLLDTRRYFDYHHTAADTLDKVDPDALRRHVAVVATLAWWLAEMPAPLPRLAIDP